MCTELNRPRLSTMRSIRLSRVLGLYFLLKMCAVHCEQQSASNIKQLVKHVDLGGILRDRTGQPSLATEMVSMTKSMTNRQAVAGPSRSKLFVVRSFSRTIDNSIKLANSGNDRSLQAPLMESKNLVTYKVKNKDPSNSSSANGQMVNVKIDREGYLRDYGGIESLKGNGLYGQQMLHSEQEEELSSLRNSEPVRSYEQASEPSTTARARPPGGIALSTTSAVSLNPNVPIVLSSPLPAIQRIVEHLPLPVEVLRTIERTPVPVPLIRQVDLPRIVPVDRPVPVPLIQQIAVPEPIPIPLIQHVPVPEPIVTEVIRHVAVPQPVPVLQPFPVDRPIFIERRIPVPEPLVRSIYSLPPTPPPVRQTFRFESTDYPMGFLKERILAPFNAASFGRFGRFLRSVTCFRDASPRIKYRR